MSSFSRAISFLIVSLTVCLSASAQSALGQILQPKTPASAPSTTTTDPLGRETPYGTIFEFLDARQSGTIAIAAQYLPMSPARRQTDGEKLAQKLKVVMDSAFAGSLKRISTQPEGTPQEAVPADRQKLGPMSSGDVEVELELVRVSDPKAGKIWLISSDTLTKVPELYDQVAARQVETRLPRWVVKHQFAGMPLWQWFALVLLIPIAAGAGWLLLVTLQVPLVWWTRKHGHPELVQWRSVSEPAWLLAGTFVHRILAGYLGMPLLQRHYYFQVTAVAVILGANWILWRVIRWFLRRVRNRALARGNAGTGSLILLGERIVKEMVIVTAVFSILVGDVCRLGDRTGTVEDIGLRSTRVRTDERTLLAIPNGTVASINLENLSRRDKMLFSTVLRLHLETPADHLRYALSEIRNLLETHPKIETKTIRVRLNELAASSLNVELFCYVLTQDFNEFAAVREELLLRIMNFVEDSGTTLASPSQTLYLSKDSGSDKTQAALKQITDSLETNQKASHDVIGGTESSSAEGAKGGGRDDWGRFARGSWTKPE